MDPKSNGRCAWKRRGSDLRHRATQGRRFVQMDTEVGVMWPQAQGGLGSPKSWAGQRDPPLEPLEGAEPCPHLDHRFLTPELGANKFVLKLFSLWPVAAATPGH